MSNLRKNNARKVMTTSAAAALAATAIAPAVASADSHTFPDVSADNPNSEAIEALAKANILEGDENGNFNPEDSMNRAQAAKMVAKLIGAEPSAGAENPFDDIEGTKYEYATEHATALSELGIIEGDGEGNFMPGKQLERAELAKMVVLAYDLELESGYDQSFDDVDEQEWYSEYVSILHSHDLIKGVGDNKFAPEDDMQRQHFALLSYDADKEYGSTIGEPELTVESVSAINATTVEVSFDGVEEPVEIELDEELEDGATTVSFEYDGHTYEDVELAEEFTVEPAVESVSAINANQIVVDFNAELLGEDENVSNDATDLANYELGDSPASNADLSEDGKSVTLTFDGGVEGDDQVLVVDPVATTKTDANGDALETEKYSTIFSYTDSVSPEVVSSSYSNDVITLQFSEKVENKPSVVRVDGTPIADTAISVDDTDSTKVNVDYAGLEAGTSASLYVAGATDTSDAANEMSFYNGTVVAPAADKDLPQISSLEVTGQNTAKVTLNEDIEEEKVNVDLQQGTTITADTLERDTSDESGKTYTLTVDGLFADEATSETFDLLVAEDAMTDSAGNKNEEIITSLTFVKDTIAPAYLSSSVTEDNKKLAFTFDEDLTVKGDTANVSVRTEDGVKIDVVDDESSLDSSDNDDTVYLLDIEAGNEVMETGNYTVTLPEGFFTDQYGNETSEVTTTFTVGEPPEDADETKPTAKIGSSDDNVFTIEYSEEVTTSALNLSNYKLDGDSLPADTDAYFTDTDKDTAELVLPEGSVNIGDVSTGTNAILNISNVEDTAGNEIDSKNYTVTVEDNTAATIQSVQVLGQDVYVTFNEDITVPDTTNAANVFDISVEDTKLDTTDVTNLEAVDGNDMQVKFTLNETPSSTPAVEVSANQSQLTDNNGYPVR